MTSDEVLQLIDQAAKTNATTLDLSGKGLTALPSEIGQLTQLKILILGKTVFNRERWKFKHLGNKLSTLPAELGQLRNLEILKLNNNQLSSLPLEIIHLTNLRSLSLASNQLSSLPPEIIHLTGLRSLSLANNQLSGLPKEIVQLTNLRSISLANNQLSSLPLEIVYLTNLRSLSLASNHLKSLPSEIVHLTNLRSLDLDNNELSTLPSEIVRITNLQTLWLSTNQLKSLPQEIVHLTNLRTLWLSVNQLNSLLPEIVHLTNLRSLSLATNELSTLPLEITHLTNLRSLFLDNNQLGSLPPEIIHLTNLRSLSLHNNQLSSLPPEIIHFTNLRSLDLYNNKLSHLSSEIHHLINLRTLSLGNNQLSDLPSEIGQLTNLRSLSVANNQLNNLPLGIVQLINLRTLSLYKNLFSDLPLEFFQLTKLRSLDLEGNRLSRLPPGIRQLTNLKRLDLRGNPLPIPPELLGAKDLREDPGNVQDILNFYFQVQDPNATEPLYEAKLLIVGEGGAGKTSLAQKLKDETYQLKPDEVSTQGIDVIPWHFTLPNGQDFRVNIWDFGGQEIYHATHQFFLTKRSLYVLVADTRKEDTDFYWWLKTVELWSDNSPALIIKNEKQDRQCDINDRQLRGEFTNLEKILATNLETNRGLPEVQVAIQQYISQLPHVGTPLPKLWVRIRAALENYSRNYIPVVEYYDLCRTNGLTDPGEMLKVSQYLHDLGVCLHFQDDKVLKHTVILKPEWGTTAVYKVLDNKTVRDQQGCFTQKDLANIWSDSQYAAMRDELLQLMMNFKLCYEIPGHADTYIAPHLLPTSPPNYEWDEGNNLILRYEYEFMPKGILTRFVVDMHRFIENQTLVWRNGVVLNNGRARAEVIEHYRYRKGEIKIRVAGVHRKELFSIIDFKFTELHDGFERLKYDTFIPCNCEQCQDSQTPSSYPLERLRQFLGDRQPIQCPQSYKLLDVRRLLDDAMMQTEEPDVDARFGGRSPKTHSSRRTATRNAPVTPTPTPRNQVFVSYSHQDQEWLTQLKKHLKPMMRKTQNLVVWEDTQIQPGAEWRKEIEAALAAAKVAVLLVSPDFLNSDFIAENELPPLLAAAQAEGLQILWVPLTYSLFEETDIEKYQAAHSPSQPLKMLSDAERDQAWVMICKKIKAAAGF
jgi:internalin A